MDKLIDYVGLGTFQTNLLNDNKLSPIATWSSEKISDELNDKANISDLSAYATTSDMTTALANKQNVLGAGNNISISNNIISARGYNFNSSKNSVAEGKDTTASGNYSHAEGRNTIASGASSHAEGSSDLSGIGSRATGISSHAEGISTLASGNYSHAEGYTTIASGQAAHTEGVSTLASGDHSHAEGDHTEAKNGAEHAEGIYNISHTGNTSTDKTIHSIGVGYTVNGVPTKKNALEVMQNGDYYLLGVGNYDGVHIKNEQGAPANLQTLQEVIAALEARIAALENPNA